MRASKTEAATGAAKLRIMVSILPQVFFVERIGGDRVEVEAIVQPGRDLHTYEITPRQMAALSDADVFFRIGVAFENGVVPQLRRVVPDLPVVDTREGIALRAMAQEEHAKDESHGHHDESGMDPHIWLAPALIDIQASTICNTLVRLDPAGKSVYEANLSRFRGEVKALDDEIKSLLSDLPHRKFMVYHPSWGYFADAYNLIQIAVEVEGKAPPAKQLARTIDQAKADGISVIFIQPQFSAKSAETIAAAIGGSVVRVDPLAKDVFASLREAAQVIRKGSNP